MEATDRDNELDVSTVNCSDIKNRKFFDDIFGSFGLSSFKGEHGMMPLKRSIRFT